MALLSLEEFRQVLGYNPWHFWGLSNGSKAPTSACNGVVYEYGWQGFDAAGRQDILRSIEAAEDTLARYLNYWPGPKYIEEVVPWPHFADSGVHRYQNVEADGSRVSLRLRYGKVQAIGHEKRTEIGTYPVTIKASADAGTTCLDDVFRLSFATTETDPSVFSVEISSNDRVVGEERDYAIRPVQITISGGRATVKGNVWLLVRPELYTRTQMSNIDPDDPDSFVKRLTIYKVEYESGQTEEDGAAILRWESHPCGGGWYCNEASSHQGEPGTEYYSVGRSGIRNGEAGIVTPDLALWDSTTSTWKLNSPWCCGSVEPDKVVIRYVSGVPYVNGRMPTIYAQMVARMAMGDLARRVCACAEANKELYRWQWDLAAEIEDGDNFKTTDADLTCPFGTSRGAIWAWKQAKSRKLLRGVPA